MIKDFDIGRFFELTTSDETYIDRLNSHENKKELIRLYK